MKRNLSPKILEQCDICGRMVVEALIYRGCASHGVIDQIESLFPFLNINHKDRIKRNSEGDIVVCEINWHDYEDVIHSCHDCGKRKAKMANSYTCWSCFGKDEDD